MKGGARSTELSKSANTFRHTVDTNGFSVSYTVSSECLETEVVSPTGQRFKGRISTHNWNAQALQNLLSGGGPTINETSQGISVTPTGWMLPPITTVPVLESDTEQKLAELEKEIKEGVPKGVIVMWSGTTIPIGWHLCDGTRGTPDLRDKFIVGAGKHYKLAETGGSKEVTLQNSQLPQRRHSVTQVAENVENDDYDEISGKEVRESSLLYNYLASGNAHPTSEHLVDHPHPQPQPTTINTIPETHPHENRPPFFSMYFIIKM